MLVYPNKEMAYEHEENCTLTLPNVMIKVFTQNT